MYNRGGSVYIALFDGSDTYNFLINRRYTFGYDGSNYFLSWENMIAAPSELMGAPAIQEPPIIPVSFKLIENRTSIR
jgi:hypothetical protein